MEEVCGEDRGDKYRGEKVAFALFRQFMVNWFIIPFCFAVTHHWHAALSASASNFWC